MTVSPVRQLNRKVGRAKKQDVSRGFPPVIGTDPRVLVLGSLPGQASLAARQYYAQPRNAFWMIMAALCGTRPELGYNDRLELLKRAGVAVWDVLYEAQRPGSLDSSIVAESQRVNDIAALVSRHATIRLIAFNGQKAAEVFRRRVAPELAYPELETVTLPSTSPAHASMTRAEKLARWRRALMPHLREVKA